jgi:hypothetical protein
MRTHTCSWIVFYVTRQWFPNINRTWTTWNLLTILADHWRIFMDVLTAACMKNITFWDMAPGSLAQVDWRFIALFMEAVTRLHGAISRCLTTVMICATDSEEEARTTLNPSHSAVLYADTTHPFTFTICWHLLSSPNGFRGHHHECNVYTLGSMPHNKRTINIE